MHIAPAFAFDLDGTLTKREIFPELAREAGLYEEISLLTQETLDGLVPFDASLRRRFALLRHLPLARVHMVISRIPLEQRLVRFIKQRRHRCAVITGNIDCWVAPLTNMLGCTVFCTRSKRVNGIFTLDRIVDKQKAVKKLAAAGAKVIAVGDSANDLPMFLSATTAIAFGGIRRPPASVISSAHYTTDDPETLYNLLESLDSPCE